VFYGFPQIDALGVKAAEHSGGVVIDDPGADPRDLDSADLARVEAFLAAHLPGVGRPMTRHSVCYYTMSPDEHFLVGQHPAHRHVCIAAGLSGHGFKFTSVLGEALADLAFSGATRLPIEFLSTRRFMAGETPAPLPGPA
jgi:sarcosine oxidase